MTITYEEAQQYKQLMILAANLNKGPSKLRVEINITYPDGSCVSYSPFDPGDL